MFFKRYLIDSIHHSMHTHILDFRISNTLFQITFFFIVLLKSIIQVQTTDHVCFSFINSSKPITYFCLSTQKKIKKIYTFCIYVTNGPNLLCFAHRVQPKNHIKVDTRKLLPFNRYIQTKIKFNLLKSKQRM